MSSNRVQRDKPFRENEVVTLSGPDWKLFYDALIDPPAPSAALGKAFAGYRKSHG